jgi:hypothetical protein
MEAAPKMLEARRAPPVMSAGWDTPEAKGRFAYLDTDSHGVPSLELIWNQPYVYPRPDWRKLSL